jgi:outer membrane receptor protein involved in Fe transport
MQTLESSCPSRHVRVVAGGVAAVAAVLLAPGVALAQATPSGSEEPLEQVVVTGSHLGDTGFATPTPVTVLGAADLERQGISNVANLLNTLPAFRAQSTPATTAIFINNAGANLADLRGLGAQRTLVLVDGRRFVPGTTAGGGFAPSGAVDLNMIPTALIRRAEVVTGGASAAYGSDAVAGVVNLILDTKLQGLKSSIQYGESDSSDTEELYATLAGGSSFADGRGHFVLGGEYVDNRGSGDCYSRDWCAVGYNTISNPSPQLNGLARQVILPASMPATASFGGLITAGPLRGTEFRSNGSVFQHDYGTFYGTAPSFANGGIFQSGGGADPQNAFYNNFPLVAPVERYSTLGHADFSFTDTLRGFLEASFGHVKATTNGSQPRNLGNLTIRRDNPYLPAAVGAAMDNLGLTSFAFGRIGNDFGPQQGLVKRDTMRAAAGLDGSFGTSGWKWDAYYQYGETNYRQRGFNTQIVDNFGRAVDAVRAPTGEIVCRSTLTNPDNPLVQGCQPLNLFGENNFSPAAVAYSFGTAIQETDLTQQVVAATVRGDLMELPAGKVSVAGGAEYRIEDASGSADAVSTDLRFFTSPGAPISGPAVKITEGFLEAGVPILAEKMWAHSLAVNAAVRRTHYSTSGSVTTWKGGVNWEPVDFLRFRATRSRDIRAPNFFELNNPVSTSFQLITDPQAGNSGVLVPVRLSGNAALDPEVADTFTAGFVVTAARDLQVALDYFDIELDGAISTLGGQVIVSRCATGATDLCSLVTRSGGATGALVSVSNPNLNLNTLKTRGVDLESSYSLPLAGGDLSMRLLGTFVMDLITVDPTGLAVDRAGMNGSPVSQPSGLPHFMGNAAFTWTKNALAGTVQVRYVSDGLYNSTLIGPGQRGYDPVLPNSVSDNDAPSMTYVDLNASYDIAESADHGVQVFGVVNNLFDRDPPNDLPSSYGVTNPVLYDVVGRAFKVGVRVTF